MRTLITTKQIFNFIREKTKYNKHYGTESNIRLVKQRHELRWLFILFCLAGNERAWLGNLAVKSPCYANMLKDRPKQHWHRHKVWLWHWPPGSKSQDYGFISYTWSINFRLSIKFTSSRPPWHAGVHAGFIRLFSFVVGLARYPHVHKLRGTRYQIKGPIDYNEAFTCFTTRF